MADTPTERESSPAAGREEYPETCGIAPDLLQLLVCPLGKAELRLENGFLVCTRCGPAFPIDDGIPILLIEEAKLPAGIGDPAELPCQKEERAAGTKTHSGDGSR